MRQLILFMLFLCITACSFHLRGSVPLAPPLHHVYIKTKDPYGQLTRNLRDYLKISHIYIAESPSDATTILDILDERESERLLSVSGTQLTRQYSLILTVIFQVTNRQGKVLVPPLVASEARTLTVAVNQILGSNNEADMLYQQMRQAIVYDMMNKLSSQHTTSLLMDKP